MKDKALKLALEALEGCHTSDKPMHQFFNKPKTDKAIAAIKEALAQPVWFSLTEEQKDSLLLPFSSYKVIDVIEAMLKENNGVSVN